MKSGVIDDDWVVRKLAQIRRRSRSIDSAIGDIPGIQTPGSLKLRQPSAKSPREETAQTASSGTSTTTASVARTSTRSVSNDDLTEAGVRRAPLEQAGGMATLRFLPFRPATVIEHLHINSNCSEQESPRPSLLLQSRQEAAWSSFAASAERKCGEDQRGNDLVEEARIVGSGGMRTAARALPERGDLQLRSTDESLGDCGKTLVRKRSGATGTEDGDGNAWITRVTSKLLWPSSAPNEARIEERSAHDNDLDSRRTTTYVFFSSHQV